MHHTHDHTTPRQSHFWRGMYHSFLRQQKMVGGGSVVADFVVRLLGTTNRPRFSSSTRRDTSQDEETLSHAHEVENTSSLRRPGRDSRGGKQYWESRKFMLYFILSI